MVKIYTANTEELKNERLFLQAYQELPMQRQRKIDKMKMEKDKRLSLGAWSLLQTGLKEWGISERELQLKYGENGKPFLKDYPNVFFNLSHSGNRVMCAISGGEVGCDVEKIKDANLKLAKRFFHEKEYERIAQLKEKEASGEMFYRLWTLKESFMKVTGLGMKLPLDDFMIDIQEDKIRVQQQVKKDASYFFKEYDLQDGYKYACCAEEAEFEEKMKIYHWDKAYTKIIVGDIR